MDQPGNVANSARGQLNRENNIPRACLRIWSRETDSAVPSRVSLLISILRLNLVLTYGIRPVCVFIKLHITAQSGPVILVILCYSH